MLFYIGATEESIHLPLRFLDEAKRKEGTTLMNEVHFLGRLVEDPTLGYTATNVAYCKFRIAVKRKYAKAGDEVQADFFNVVAWNKQAEFVSKYFTKGERIIIHGEVRNADWIKDGVKHYSTEILANRVEFSGDPKAKEEVPTGQATETLSSMGDVVEESMPE